MTWEMNHSLTNEQKARWYMSEAFKAYEACETYRNTIGWSRAGYTSLYSRAECLAKKASHFFELS